MCQILNFAAFGHIYRFVTQLFSNLSDDRLEEYLTLP